MKITIRHWDGQEFSGVEIDAFGCGVPGLAVHAAHEAVGWVITHVPSGLRAAWFPDADPEWVLACATELGKLGDWTGMPDSELTRFARVVIDNYGGRLAGTAAPRAAAMAEWSRALAGLTADAR